MNRRGFIAGSAAAVAVSQPAQATSHDDFADIIRAAVKGDAAYNVHPGAGGDSKADAEAIAKTYGPPYARICAGNLPTPLSAASAASGLRYCQAAFGFDPAGAAIVDAVARYLEAAS